MVSEIIRQMESARTIVIANYMGLKAQEMEEFRNLLKPVASDCMVVKNTLLSKVLEKASLPALTEHLTGPTAVIFGKGDDVLIAKRVMQFSKDHEPLKIKVGILGRNILSKAQILQLAMLPSKEVLLGKLVGTLKGPIYGLANVLAALPRGLVIALNAIKENKEKSQGSVVVAPADGQSAAGA